MINILQLIAVITGLLGVYLTTKQNVLCMPIGIINVLLTAFLVFNERLYSDAMLQLFYFGFLVYGWIRWTKIQADYGTKKIFHLRVSELLIIVGFIIACTILVGSITQEMNADYAYPDAALLAASLAAQFLQSRKYMENWYIWIITNIAYTLLFFVKGMPLFAWLSVCYLLLAVRGYMVWSEESSL